MSEMPKSKTFLEAAPGSLELLALRLETQERGITRMISRAEAYAALSLGFTAACLGIAAAQVGVPPTAANLENAQVGLGVAVVALFVGAVTALVIIHRPFFNDHLQTLPNPKSINYYTWREGIGAIRRFAQWADEAFENNRVIEQRDVKTMNAIIVMVILQALLFVGFCGVSVF